MPDTLFDRAVERAMIAANDAANEDDDDHRGIMRAALLAALREIKEPDDGMRRAWVVERIKDGIDAEEPVPLVGTGQGDLTMVPRWKNLWATLHCEERWRAMIDCLIHQGEKGEVDG